MIPQNKCNRCEKLIISVINFLIKPQGFAFISIRETAGDVLPPLASSCKKKPSDRWSRCLRRKQTAVAFHQSQWVRVSQEMRNIRPLVYSYPDEYTTSGLGSDGRGSIISASSYEHSSLSASETQLYCMMSERFRAQGHRSLQRGCVYWRTLDPELMSMDTVNELYNDQSEILCSAL